MLAKQSQRGKAILHRLKLLSDQVLLQINTKRDFNRESIELLVFSFLNMAARGLILIDIGKREGPGHEVGKEFCLSYRVSTRRKALGHLMKFTQGRLKYT